MKRLKKYAFFFAAACLFTGLGYVSLQAQKASAYNYIRNFERDWLAQDLEGFTMIDGASVRKNEENPGLRFSTTITEEAYEALVAAYPTADFRFYTVIDKANNNDVGEEVEILGDIAFSEEDNAYIYHAAIIFENLTEEEKEQAYAMELEAKAYVEILSETGNVLAVYSANRNDNVRCMRAVANVMLLEEYYANDTEKEIYERYVGETVRCETLDFCETIEGEENSYLARGAFDDLTKGYSSAYYGARKVGVISESGELTFLEGCEYFNNFGDKVVLSFFNDENDVYTAEMQYVTKGIKTEDDLSCLTLSGSEKLTGFYALGNDLKTTKTTNLQPNVSDSTTLGFAGVFEGNGYELTLHRLNKNGLFGVLSDAAEIKNVSIQAFCSSIVSGDRKANSIIAYQVGESGAATIENVFITVKDRRTFNDSLTETPRNLCLFYQTVSGRIITLRDVVIENNTYNADYLGGVLFYQDKQSNTVFDNVFFITDAEAELGFHSTAEGYTDYSAVEGLSRLVSYDLATETQKEEMLGVEIFKARGEHTTVSVGGETGNAVSLEVGEEGVSVPVSVVSFGETMDCTVSVLEGNGLSINGNILTATKACDGKISVSYSLNGETVEEYIDVYFYKRASFEGTHDVTATITENYLVQDGESEYVLVLPCGYSTTLSSAKDEFITLFEAATGIELSFVEDDGSIKASGGKYISLGETELFLEAYPEEELSVLGRDGGRILTDGNDIYIVGGSDFGTLYAVYTFMSITFNYEQYSIDCMEIDITDEKELFDYDVTDIPDFSYRINNYGVYDYGDETDENWVHFDERMGLGTYRNDLLLTIFEEYNNKTSSNAAFHNSKKYLPNSIYEESHPKWYADTATVVETNEQQLCYTAHGDEKELALMIEECAKKIENSLTLYPRESYLDKNTVTLTVQDGGNGYCTCSACLASVQTYGSYAGMIAQFVNRVGELVETWMSEEQNEPYRRDDFKIIFFAYNLATNAPCEKNENGEWTAIDDSVKLRSNVAVWLAPIKNIEYQQSIYAPINKAGKDNIDAWATLSDDVYYWTYSTNFSAYMYPYDSFKFFYEDGGYTYLLANGGKYIFNQAQNTQQGALTSWHGLKLYLDAKLSWDCNLDVDALIDEWFDAMFMEAAPTMKALFVEQRAYYAEICKEYDLYQVRSLYTEIENPIYWKYDTLTEWLSNYDTALASVVDSDMYATLEKRIKAEWVSTAYMLLQLWTPKLGADATEELLEEFAYTVKELGITNISEHAGDTGSGLIENWIQDKNSTIYEKVFGADETEETMA